jgi:hypothetical protein
MPLFERDSSKHLDSDIDAQIDAQHRPATTGSNSDADNSAAHIAELVRRTTERNARPSPSCVAPSNLAHTPPGAPAASWPRPVAQQVAEPQNRPARTAIRKPAPRVLVAGGVIAALLVAGGLVLSRPDSSDAGPTATIPAVAAPAGYTVKVTDVISDCASHSRGRTRSSFQAQNCVKATRSLATGRVSGRPALFVVSRIQMASVEAAATIKQILDGTGTGNLNDLLREGKTFPGAPRKMPVSGYASVQTGTVILVAEAGLVDGSPSRNTNPALRAAASQVAALVTSTR